MSELLTQLETAIKCGKRKDATAATTQALEQQVPANEILTALTAGMDDVGRRFKANDIFVPEVLVAARAMKTAMEILEPVLVAAGIEPEHTIVIGTVEGDLHDIGKNLVSMMLKGANFKVVDLGTNVPIERFIKALDEDRPSIIALSALLTTTMPKMKETVAALKAQANACPIMVGGAPITQDFADQIGAEGYATDAGSAVELVRSLCATK